MRGLLTLSVLPLMLASAVALADPVQPTQTQAAPMAPATTATPMAPVTTATPTQSAQPTVQTASAPTGDPNEVICKSQPPPTGSRLGGRTECHTRDQWDQRMREQQRMLQQQQALPMNAGGN